MNKADLVEKIAAAHGISKTAAGGAIDTIIDSVTECVEKGRSRYPGRIWDLFGFPAKGA